MALGTNLSKTHSYRNTRTIVFTCNKAYGNTQQHLLKMKGVKACPKYYYTWPSLEKEGVTPWKHEAFAQFHSGPF